MAAGEQADPEVYEWITAIHQTETDSKPGGSGIILDGRRILTCAHVIKDMPEPWVAFPQAKGTDKFVRRRVDDVIRPVVDAKVEDPYILDLVILVLAEPIPHGAAAAPLCFPEAAKLIGQRWWAYGFPKQDPVGSTADGWIGGKLSYGWLRLHKQSPDPLASGFSGGGLWCQQFDGVVAVVTQAEPGAGGGRAITLAEADEWFPNENLRHLADRRATSLVEQTDVPTRDVTELAAQLAERPDSLAIIHDVYGHTAARVERDASIVQLLTRLRELVGVDGPALLGQLRDLAGENAPTTQPTGPSADGACLLIVLRRDDFVPDGFLLWLTLFHDGQPGVPQQCDQPSGSLAEIQGQLRVLVPQILEATHGLALIEFAVPEDMIDWPFDQWPVARRPGRPPAEDSSLGVLYRVVVRDLDRMDPELSARAREKWEYRWKLLLAREELAKGLLREVEVRTMARLTAEAGFQALTADFQLPEGESQAVLALLPTSGKRLRADARKKAVIVTLKAGLAEGLPAALWLRRADGRRANPETTGDAADRAYLKRVLDHEGLEQQLLPRDLPRLVRILRARAAARARHASHQGYRLSLLWADPSRTWPPGDLQLPQTSSNGADCERLPGLPRNGST
jgi:vWA-MoxR associated protein C-terminal domain/Trypsin-like peptidase domain